MEWHKLSFFWSGVRKGVLSLPCDSVSHPKEKYFGLLFVSSLGSSPRLMFPEFPLSKWSCWFRGLGPHLFSSLLSSSLLLFLWPDAGTCTCIVACL